MYFLGPILAVPLWRKPFGCERGTKMQFKEFLIVLWASTLLGITGYMLFAQRIGAWGASLLIFTGAIFLVLVLNMDVISSFAASWGEQFKISVETKQLKEELFAKVEYVRKLGEEMARFAAHTVATGNRWVGEDHENQMLDERERIRAMMKALDSEPSKIAEVLDQIDKTVASDLKGRVVGAVGRIQKGDQKALERLTNELREKLRVYESPASRDNIVSFLKERNVHDETVEKALDRLDLFLREKRL